MGTGFILGIGISAAVVLLFGAYFFGKNIQFIHYLETALKKELAKDLENAHMAGSVNYRFKQLNKLTKQQFDLASKLDTPSKGASHSRWKRELGQQLKELEEAKLDIFKTFLEDDIDPIITVMNPDGDARKIKISEFLAEQNGHDIPPSPTTEKSTDSNNHRKGILKLVKETNDGKNSTDNPGDPALH